MAIEIPTISSQAAALVALFEAALAARPWSTTIADASAGETLIAWARSKGLRITETHFVVSHQEPYANLAVHLDPDSSGYSIDVLAYRALTDDEIARVSVRTKEREAERIGTAQVVL